VSWRENKVVVRIAVLLVGTGMALFVSRNRRKKGLSAHRTMDVAHWYFLSSWSDS